MVSKTEGGGCTLRQFCQNVARQLDDCPFVSLHVHVMARMRGSLFSKPLVPPRKSCFQRRCDFTILAGAELWEWMREDKSSNHRRREFRRSCSCSSCSDSFFLSPRTTTRRYTSLHGYKGSTSSKAHYQKQGLGQASSRTPATLTLQHHAAISIEGGGATFTHRAPQLHPSPSSTHRSTSWLQSVTGPSHGTREYQAQRRQFLWRGCVPHRSWFFFVSLGGVSPPWVSTWHVGPPGVDSYINFVYGTEVRA